ncbi:MAG: hypothetical protein LUG89_01450 [Methanosphaera sp.]|nr:hypothetical protein [Methanosphaera sp.]
MNKKHISLILSFFLLFISLSVISAQDTNATLTQIDNTTIQDDVGDNQITESELSEESSAIENTSIEEDNQVEESGVTNNTVISNDISSDINGTVNSSKTIKATPVVVINVDDIVAAAGQTIEIKGTIFDADGSPLSHKIVFKVNGISYISTWSSNGKFTFNFTVPDDWSTRNYTVTFVSGETRTYPRTEKNVTLTVTPFEVLSVNTTNTTYAGQTVHFSGNTKIVNGTLATVGTVIIKINSNTIAKINMTDGTFSYDYYVPDGYTAKNYTVTYVFLNETSRHEMNRTLTINYQESDIVLTNVSVVNNKLYVSAEITGLKTHILAVSGNLGFKINGVTVKNSDGTPYILNVVDGVLLFIYDIPDTMKTGNYNITLTYSGARSLTEGKSTTRVKLVIYNQVEESGVTNNNVLIKSISSDSNGTVNDSKNIKTDDDIVIDAGDIVVGAGRTITINGTVSYADGYHPYGGTVVFKVNGNTYETVGFSYGNGMFSFNFTVPEDWSAKTYNITYVNVETFLSSRAEKNATLTVTPLEIFTINTTNVTYAGQTVHFSGNNTEKINGSFATTGTVLIKINGNTIARINMTNGTFSYDYRIPDNYSAKDYTVTYIFIINETSRYEMNRTLAIKCEESDIVLTNVSVVNNKLYVNVEITGLKSHTLATSGKVGFKIDGVTVRNSDGTPYILSITNGVATFVYDIPDTNKTGNYNITLTYSGSITLGEGRSTTRVKLVI